MGSLRKHRPSPALLISFVALALSLGGTSYAALKLPKNSVGAKQLRQSAVTSSKVKDHSLTGADVDLASLGTIASATNAGHAARADSAAEAANAANAANATTAQDATHAKNADRADNATNAANAGDAAKLAGSPAVDYLRYGSTLPSGRSESGDYGIRTANTGTTGFLDTAVTFPVPLASRIPKDKVVTTTAAGTTHCSGPGRADAGFLCIYEVDTFHVTGPPEVLGFENRFPTDESGNFGFDMEWTVNGANAFSIGTWTVTAP